MNVYDFSVRAAAGKTVSLEQYRGMVSLIVNTASLDRYAEQLSGLEKLYKKYGGMGFMLLLFPSNQFYRQEPDSDTAIQNIYRSSFGVTAPIFAKIDVNGPVSDRLYRYLIESKRFDARSFIPEDMKILYLEIDHYYYTSSDIKWNFTKFLIGRDGRVIKRLEPEVTPEMLEADILVALEHSVQTS